MKEMSREEALARIEFRVRCACPQANGDHIGECNGCWRYPCNDMKAVNLLAQERPYGEWIPCSERLPEDDKEVLVYVREKDVKKSELNGLHIARRHQMEGDPEGNNNFWGVPVAPCEWRIAGWSYFFEPEVLAWMPLPEPYKEGGDSDA